MFYKTYIASVPSNIAFLKYWGRLDEESKWPTNNSLSMTLNKSRTTTLSKVREDLECFEIFLEKKEIKESSFALKIREHLVFLKKTFNFSSYLEVSTSNNFPTASGVASSASGFAALTLSSLAAWTSSESLEDLREKGFDLEKLSSLSRFGSGSACRSLMGGFVLWEKGEVASAQKTGPILPASYWNLSDTIIVLSKEEKALSSREAHKRVTTSPLFAPRIFGLGERQRAIEEALMRKDIKALGSLLEGEALDIHAVIMTASEPFSYLKEETLGFLCWLRELRTRVSLEAYFTIDAGPNVHVICEEKDQERFLFYLRKEKPHLDFIKDGIGSGPGLSCKEL